jgi:hypothetical protein
MLAIFNPLKTKFVRFIQELGAYRAVNTPHLKLYETSLLMVCKVKVRTEHINEM